MEQKNGARELGTSNRRNLKVNLCRLLKARENPAEALVPFGWWAARALRKFQSTPIERVMMTVTVAETARQPAWTTDIHEQSPGGGYCDEHLTCIALFNAAVSGRRYYTHFANEEIEVYGG